MFSVKKMKSASKIKADPSSKISRYNFLLRVVSVKQIGMLFLALGILSLSKNSFIHLFISKNVRLYGKSNYNLKLLQEGHC